MAYPTLNSRPRNYAYPAERERRHWRWLTVGSVSLVASFGYLSNLVEVRDDLKHYIEQNKAIVRHVETQDFSPARQTKLATARANLRWAEEFSRTGVNPYFRDELRMHFELAQTSHQGWDSAANGP